MQHEFYPMAVKKKWAQSGQHPASRAAEANHRVGGGSNQDFARGSPDQIGLDIRDEFIFGCPMDMKPRANRVDHSVLSFAQTIDGHGSLASLRRH